MHRNVRIIYLFVASRMFILIMPVIVPLFLKHGLNMQQVFTLQAIFAATIAITEVPSGYLSDLFGRKRTLMLGSLITALAWTLLAGAKDYLGFILFEVLIALGLSFISGTDQALLYGTLNQQNATQDEHTKAIGYFQQTLTWAEAFAAIVSFFLLTHGIEFVAKIQMYAGWIPFFSALFLKEIPYKKMSSKSHGKNFKIIIRRMFVKDRVLRMSVINQTLYGMATFIAVWIYQKYWQDIGIELKFFGLIWAAYNFVVGLTARQVHSWEKQIGSISLIGIMGMLPVIAYFGVGMTQIPFWVVTFGFGFQISRGLSQVIFKDAIHRRLQDRYRATAMSILSLLFRGVFFIIGPVIGFLIDRYGIPVSLKIMSGVYILVYLFSLLPLLLSIDEMRRPVTFED